MGETGISTAAMSALRVFHSFAALDRLRMRRRESGRRQARDERATLNGRHATAKVASYGAGGTDAVFAREPFAIRIGLRAASVEYAHAN